MKVSIIIPCYNVEKTLLRALDSIIMQVVDFEYEILVVDDASTDNTVNLAQQYAELYPQVKIICNRENHGNAYTYYTGLCAAQGDYFCVLDGDDYYTVPDKLQRQVNFLEADTESEYVGTATQYIIDLGNDMVCVPDRSTYQEFTYTDFLTMHSGYYHTATYMYRNIFRGNVPFSISDVLYRGDTPRTMFHLMYSGKKIKILDFIGSAYTFEFQGIWSGLKQKQQFEYQINYQTRHKENVTTNFERESADKIIQFNVEKLKIAQDDVRRYPAISIEQALQRIEEYAGRFAFGQKDFVLKHAYYSQYIDTLCASLGYIDRVRHPDHVQWKSDSNHICIINGVLNPKGGGIFAEINELIGMFPSKHVYLIVSNMKEVPDEVINILSKHKNLTLICPPVNVKNRFSWFQERIVEISPYRCYYYCSHRDAFGAALVQPGTPENIVLFSFDHGYLCGISNPYFNTIAAKRPVDYYMLRKKFGSKVFLLPAWSKGASNCENYQYVPFHNHDHLVTASGAARYYKINGKPPYRYIDLIITLLKKTKGKHFHFGELPDDILAEINSKLKQAELDNDSFVHIPWANNIPLELLKQNVDIFIEPFPVVSYKLTLEVLSVGIPVIARQGLMRMEITDFIPRDALFWSDDIDFLNQLSALDSTLLQEKSRQSIEYFDKYHSIEQIKKCLYNNTGMEVPPEIIYPDNTLIDIMDSLRMFGNDFKISIIDGIDATRKKREAERIRQEKERQKKENDEILKKQKLKEKAEYDAKRNIQLIRNSKRFKIGFFCTFPFRFSKQFIVQTAKLGPVNGLKKTQKLMPYVRNNPIEELNVLKNSIAFKVGESLAKPYYFIHHNLFKRKQNNLKQKFIQHNKEICMQLQQQQSKLNNFQKDIITCINYCKTMEGQVQSSISNLNETMQHQFQESNTLNQELILSLRKVAFTQKNDYAHIQNILPIVSNNLDSINRTINEKFDEVQKQIAQTCNIPTNMDTRIVQSVTQAISKTIARNSIEHLDFHLTEHCNLNCVGCSTFAPIADKKFASLDFFERDMNLLHSLIGDTVQQIHLLGGEPLLHPQVAEFAKKCRSIFKSARIDITTNGILIFNMSDDFWKVLKENNIAIKYTQYPINFDYTKMVNYIQSKGIYVFSAGGEHGIKYFRRIPLNAKGTFNMYNSFIECPYTDCVQLKDGKLYHCPASAFSELLNKRINESSTEHEIFHLSNYDYLDLTATTKKEDVFKFLSNAIPFCQYCDMRHKNDNILWKTSEGDIKEWVDFN